MEVALQTFQVVKETGKYNEARDCGEELSKVRHHSILISKKGLTTEVPIHTCNNPKRPLMQPQQKKTKEREALDWSHNGVNYFSFVGRKILSLFHHPQKWCPRSVST